MMEHLLPIQIERTLQFGIGFFWTITYILIINKGFRDRTCGMPFAALCANLTWEFQFSFIFPFQSLQHIVNLIWFFLDVIILYQFVIYSKDLSPSLYTKYLTLLTSLAIAFLINIGITIEFNDYEGKYSAFGINLMMSILFIRMLLMQDLRGQSIYIAFSKMTGTLCASILFFSLYPNSILLSILYVIIFILDVIYIIMINAQTTKVIYRTNADQVKSIDT